MRNFIDHCVPKSEQSSRQVCLSRVTAAVKKLLFVFLGPCCLQHCSVSLVSSTFTKTNSGRRAKNARFISVWLVWTLQNGRRIRWRNGCQVCVILLVQCVVVYLCGESRLWCGAQGWGRQWRATRRFCGRAGWTGASCWCCAAMTWSTWACMLSATRSCCWKPSNI